MRPEPTWLGRLAIDEAHFRQIRDHGGAHGLRDENALEAGLARPRHRWRYEPDASIAQLAATYGFGIIRNHPHVDGNKRVGLIALVAFLDLNGYELTVSNMDALTAILAVADGTMSEEGLTTWVDLHVLPTTGETPSV